MYSFGRCSAELSQLVPLPYSQGRSTLYSNKLHDFSVTIPRHYMDVMSTVSFLAEWKSGILCLQNVFLEPLIEIKVKRQFSKNYLYCKYIYIYCNCKYISHEVCMVEMLIDAGFFVFVIVSSVYAQLQYIQLEGTHNFCLTVLLVTDFQLRIKLSYFRYKYAITALTSTSILSCQLFRYDKRLQVFALRASGLGLISTMKLDGKKDILSVKST